MLTVKSKFSFLVLMLVAFTAMANNIVEEIAWVVGDEPIYKSEIEEQYMQMQYDTESLEGDPYCVIPERMAVEKLFLHQAKIDTVEVQDAMVLQEAESTTLSLTLARRKKLKLISRNLFLKLRKHLWKPFATNIQFKRCSVTLQRMLRPPLRM